MIVVVGGGGGGDGGRYRRDDARGGSGGGMKWDARGGGSGRPSHCRGGNAYRDNAPPPRGHGRADDDDGNFRGNDDYD
jgi:hypothetical protein